MNKCFYQKDWQMSNKHMKICSTSIAIWKRQIKTTISYHFIPPRMARIKNTKNNKSWKGCREIGPTLLVEMQNGVAALENNLAVPKIFRHLNYMTQKFYS